MENHADEAFVRELRRALRNLYNSRELVKSTLLERLGAERRKDPSSSLARTLVQAIESLKPEASAPPQASSWRIYHILTQRFIEQSTQREVAANLAVSIRHLERLERAALQVLADSLRARLLMAQPARGDSVAPPGVGDGVPLGDGAASSRERELEWLKRSHPTEAADIGQLIRAVRKTVDSLARAMGVGVVQMVPDDLPRLAVHLTSVRQGLLAALTAAIRSVPGGQVHIEAQARAAQVWIDVRAAPNGDAGSYSLPKSEAENLRMARELVEISGGSLELAPDTPVAGPFTARLKLPIAEQVTVLVIDDNVDTLQLLQRYLIGTRYRFVGASDPQQGITLAQDLAPQIIVLDVMLPGTDGWELLAWLREHPKTRGVPIIVCTILPQEELALSLGAVAFVSKPVSRTAFLSALDHQVGPSGKGCR